MTMTTLYVGNLSSDVDVEATRTLFSGFGTVTSVSLTPGAPDRRYQGYGFVEMAAHEAQGAAAELDGKAFKGTVLCVHEASETDIARRAPSDRCGTITGLAPRVKERPPVNDYQVAAIEKTDRPDGADEEKWYRYVITGGRSPITGLRPGTRAEVTEYAQSCADSFNQRNKQGRSQLSSPFRKKK